MPPLRGGNIQELIIFGYLDKSDMYDWAVINLLMALGKHCIHTRRTVYINNERLIELIPYFKYRLKNKVNFEYQRCLQNDNLCQFECLFAQNNAIVEIVDGINNVFTII